MPAVIASFSFLALAIRSAVRYAGQKGCEITTSASGSSRSNRDPGPSLSEVTTKVWPFDSRYLRRPSSPETLPSNAPGLKSVAFGSAGSGRLDTDRFLGDCPGGRISDSRPRGHRRGRI